MEFVKEFVRKRVFFEWHQKAKLVDSLLRGIVQSKRLLADHIELLEQCQVIPIDCVESSTRKKYTIQLMGGLALSSLSIASMKSDINCLRILVPTVATTYGLYLSVETVFMIKNRLTQRRLNETISCLDKADAAIRKNISFFRESKFLGDPSTSDRYDRCGNCLKSISEIIRIIYAEVNHLESIVLPEHIESMYEPVEELSTCIYFQKNIEEFTSDDIKDFYNIFLYFQSQYLTRLCLIIFYVRDYGLRYLSNENIRLRTNLRTNIERLSVWLDESLQKIGTKSRSDASRLESNNSDDVDVLDLVKMKRSSMDILCRLIAITNQYQSTDQRIQSLHMNMNKEKMLDISVEMNRVKESIVACQDDIETLKLIYNKCLAKKFQLLLDQESDQQKTVAIPAVDESKLVKEEENPVEEDDKEYFAMRDMKNDEDSDSDGENEKSKRAKWSDELENIDMKVTRSFFAPVLKQLKTKIDPIKEEMKEREMKFLMSKGIDREKIIEFNRNEEAEDQNMDSDADSGSGSDNEPIKLKSKQRPNRYDEMRAYLEQKQPIGFMPLGDLPPPSGSEEVLE